VVQQEGVGGAAGAETVLNCVRRHICICLRSFAASTHLLVLSQQLPRHLAPAGGCKNNCTLSEPGQLVQKYC